jgi:hypothetical protein
MGRLTTVMFGRYLATARTAVRASTSSTSVASLPPTPLVPLLRTLSPSSTTTTTSTILSGSSNGNGSELSCVVGSTWRVRQLHATTTPSSLRRLMPLSTTSSPTSSSSSPAPSLSLRYKSTVNILPEELARLQQLEYQADSNPSNDEKQVRYYRVCMYLCPWSSFTIDGRHDHIQTHC